MNANEAMLVHVESRCVNYAGHVDRNKINRLELSIIEELESAGYLVNVGTYTHPVCRLTDKGWAESHRLRRHLAEQNLPGRAND